MKTKQARLLIKTPESSHSISLKNFYKYMNFEFMDLEYLPSSLRSALRDLLEISCITRGFYHWVAADIYDYARKNKISEIIELGAGCAPITKTLIKDFPQWDVKFKITDINPDLINFKKLEATDNRITAVYESHDFTKRFSLKDNTLLVLSATFHHVDEFKREKLLSNLKSISKHVLIFEPIKPEIASKLLALCGVFSGVIAPLAKIKSKSFFRCMLWCWIVPVAPFMFSWDGIISSFRCWSKKKWKSQEPNSIVEETFLSAKITLKS